MTQLPERRRVASIEAAGFIFCGLLRTRLGAASGAGAGPELLPAGCVATGITGLLLPSFIFSAASLLLCFPQGGCSLLTVRLLTPASS